MIQNIKKKLSHSPHYKTDVGNFGYCRKCPNQLMFLQGVSSPKIAFGTTLPKNYTIDDLAWWTFFLMFPDFPKSYFAVNEGQYNNPDLGLFTKM